MIATLGITFPIFATIGIGYLLTARGVLNQEALQAMGRFVMMLAMPALMFKALASSDARDVINLDYLLVYALGGLSCILVTALWFRRIVQDPATLGIAVLGSTIANSAFVGYPIFLMILPEQAGIILALNFLVEVVLLIPMCLFLVDMGKPGQHRPILHHIAGVLLSVLRRPLMIGLLLGLGVSLLGIELPAPFTRLTELFAGATTVLALIVVGGSLVGTSRKNHGTLAAQISVAKLILHPALVASIAALLMTFGLATLPPELHMALVVSAAMPMFSIYAVFAQEAGQAHMASAAMLTATLASYVTVNGVLMIFQ